jgi:hypothetical protein
MIMNLEKSNCAVLKVKTTDGTMFVTFIEDDLGKTTHILIQIGKTGTQIRAWTESMEVLINTLLDAGEPLISIATKLSNINTDKCVYQGDRMIRSGPGGLVYAINKHISVTTRKERPPFDQPWL